MEATSSAKQQREDLAEREQRAALDLAEAAAEKEAALTAVTESVTALTMPI